jgi:hypothetical protein
MLRKIMIIGAVVAAATVESSAQQCSTCVISLNALASNALVIPVTGNMVSTGHGNLNGRVVGISSDPPLSAPLAKAVALNLHAWRKSQRCPLHADLRGQALLLTK